MKAYIFLFLVLVAISTSRAQQEETPPLQINAIAKYQNNKIVLRWAVTNSSAWLKLNTHGYTIERYLVKKEGQLLPIPQKKILTPSPIAPKPVADWEELVMRNDYAAILAQALYGENFDVNGGQDGMTQLLNKAKVIEQRFSFALFAADMNFEAAQMAALGYEDTDFEKNAEYVYRIISAVPKDSAEINYGSAVVNTAVVETLPQPIDLYAIPDDKTIMLTWEYELFKSKFTSYFIERSENGSDYKRLSDTPMVNLNDKPDTPAKRMFYVDTLSQNNKKYHYRVIGVSPFGEESPPSASVAAIGVKTLSATPHILNYVIDDMGAVKLLWHFEEKAQQEISSFILNWAPKEKGPYTEIQKDIPPSSRETTYNTLGPSNYFTITAIGKHGQRKTSFSKFVQPIDSIPPTAPIGVVGTVDTLGIVRLQWEANTEKDMLGYRVFRGHRANEEVVQLTVSPIERLTYQDTVQIKSLNTKVYYQIVAVDQRFNMSAFSEKLILKKPDIVPPSAPVFQTYAVKKDSIYLKWINSSSDDVVSHILYRQATAEATKGWQTVFETDTITTYTDSKIQPNIQYRYAIFATDESGLQSLPATPISVTSQNSIDKLIKGVIATPDRTQQQIKLSWKKMPSTVLETLIYRAKGEELPVLLRQVPNTVKSIIDTKVSPNNIYTYILKVVVQDGGQTNIRTVKVTY